MPIELMTTQQVADELQLSTRQVYELYRRGEIRPLNLGHRTKRVTRAELTKYITNRMRTDEVSP